MSDESFVVDVLLEEVLRRQIQPGEKLGESTISTRFDIPRATVRGALRRLAQNGVLSRARRFGTTPRADYFEYDPLCVTQMQFDYGRCRTRSAVRVEAGAIDAALLEIPVGETYTRLERESVVDDVVIEHWSIWTLLDPLEHFGRVGVPDELTWYEVVAAITQADFQVERRWGTIIADEVDAQMIGVPVGDPVAFMVRTIRDADGRLIDHGFGRRNSAAMVGTQTDWVRVHDDRGKQLVTIAFDDGEGRIVRDVPAGPVRSRKHWNG